MSEECCNINVIEETTTIQVIEETTHVNLQVPGIQGPPGPSGESTLQTFYKTATYSLTISDDLVAFRVTVSGQEAILPTLGPSYLDHQWTIKNHALSTHSIDITPTGPDVVEGVAGQSFRLYPGDAYMVTVIYNGSSYEAVIT